MLLVKDLPAAWQVNADLSAAKRQLAADLRCFEIDADAVLAKEDVQAALFLRAACFWCETLWHGMPELLEWMTRYSGPGACPLSRLPAMRAVLSSDQYHSFELRLCEARRQMHAYLDFDPVAESQASQRQLATLVGYAQLQAAGGTAAALAAGALLGSPSRLPV
eukprot:scaffold27.g6008.t1